MTKLVKIVHILLILSALFIEKTSIAQGLSFTRPAKIFTDQQTDREPSITGFEGNYFVAWKEAGSTANILLSDLGKQYDTSAAAPVVRISGATSSFAPLLQPFHNRLYLFWINPKGSIQYLVRTKEQGFDPSAIHEIVFTDPVKVALGIDGAELGERLVLSAHADNKEGLLYTLLEVDANGLLQPGILHKIPQEKSRNYPHVTAINNTTARFCWQGKNDQLFFADYDATRNSWSEARPKGNSQTQVSPVIHQVYNSDQLFYIWRGYKKDNRLYYKMGAGFASPRGHTELPPYFTTDLPVSVCKVDANNFLMAYTGPDRQLYLSNFSAYQPARWMEQVLQPRTSNKTLKDIVIPGSHDAGMSVLTATGGQQKGTINECNTLTQKLNIENQLNGGVRMFDLRIGTFNKMLYTKHCSSDCMDEALGGGFGERLYPIATAIKKFLQSNPQEIVMATFSHFCEKETPLAGLKDSLIQWIGQDHIYVADKTTIGDVPLRELAGKAILSFEIPDQKDHRFPGCSIADTSTAFINFRRAYAATNKMNELIEKEKRFFISLNNTLNKNDLVRLDWQITQSADEAPVICNEFQDEKINPLVNGVMLLANVIRKNKSIIDHSIEGNKWLPVKLNEWINEGIINRQNKPNIVYVDVAGAWITDYCIDLMRTNLYN